MQETGVRNGAFGADKFGLKKLGSVYWNLGTAPLYEHALHAGEAVLTAEGALCAETGVFTGRSPKDKFTVRDANTDKTMWWGGNQSITSEQFQTLHDDVIKHCEGKTLLRRISTAAPIRSSVSRPASTLSSHGTRCSSARCSFVPRPPTSRASCLS